SSRRRHTISKRDWSSDVCSSDLGDHVEIAGNFDVVTIGSYDAPFWGKYQWVTSLEPFFEKMSSSERSDYDRDDLLGPIRSILSRSEERRVGKEGGAGWRQ